VALVKAEASVSGLLKTAASLVDKEAQILIATSEQLENVQQLLLICRASSWPSMVRYSPSGR
jgi:hypothetical protein